MLRPTRTVAAVALGFVLLQACDDDGSGGGDDTGSTSSTSTTDDYPSVTGELRELQEACERSYDPDWAEPEGRAGAPGFPDLTAGPEDPYIGGRESDDGDDAVDERNVGQLPPRVPGLLREACVGQAEYLRVPISRHVGQLGEIDGRSARARVAPENRCRRSLWGQRGD